MEEEQISVTFKLTSGKRFNVLLCPSLTVKDTKGLVAPHCDIPPAQQRYIFKGQILKDEETLMSYKISSGNTIHLVRGRAEEAKPCVISSSVPIASSGGSETTGGLGGVGADDTLLDGLNGQVGRVNGLGSNLPSEPLQPQLFQSLMSNSMIQSVMQEIMANPELFRSVIQTNPFLNQAAGSNPLLQSTLANPEFLRFAVNPSVMQAIMNLQQTLQNQDGSQAPVTMDHPSTTGSPVNPLTGSQVSPDQQPFNAANWQNLMGRMLRDSDVLRQMETAFQNVPGQSEAPVDHLLSHMLAHTQATQANQLPPETRYQVQLQQLEDMGFIDKHTNLVALEHSGGDVNSAIAWLLEDNERH